MTSGKLWAAKVTLFSIITLAAVAWSCYLSVQNTGAMPDNADLLTMAISALMAQAYLAMILEVGFSSIFATPDIKPYRLPITAGLTLVVAASAAKFLELHAKNSREPTLVEQFIDIVKTLFN